MAEVERGKDKSILFSSFPRLTLNVIGHRFRAEVDGVEHTKRLAGFAFPKFNLTEIGRGKEDAHGSRETHTVDEVCFRFA